MLTSSKEITIMDLTKLIGKLGLTAQAILPAQLQVRHLQRLQIQVLKLSKCYHARVHLDKDAKDELFWCMENLRLCNGKSDLCISTDLSTKGWGATCQGISTGGAWSQEEQKAHINILELKAVHLAILTFTKFQTVQKIHVQMDNKIALSYLVKMGGTHSKDLLGLSKQIWDYLQSKKITITTEYLPGHLNVTADWESHNFQDKSYWKLSLEVFAKFVRN